MGSMTFFYVGKDGEIITQPVRNRSCERKTAAGVCAAARRGTTSCSGCTAWYEAHRAEREAEIEEERERKRMHRQRRDKARAILRKRKRIHDIICRGIAYGSAAAVFLLAMLPASSTFDFKLWPAYLAAFAVPMGYLTAYLYANGEEYRAKKEREQLRRLLRRAEKC